MPASWIAPDAGEFDDPDPGQWPAHRRASNVSVISAHLYI